MLGELGQICLIAALLLALCLGVLPLLGVQLNNQRLIRIAPLASIGLFLLVAAAFALLMAAFIVQDFSIAYVARNSNSLLPMHYRVSAVWGAHEGSLLLWILILAGWTLAVALFSRRLPQSFRAQVLAVLGWVTLGFLAFTLWTSNPFTRLLPSPIDGHDLNPLLQDPGLIVHPPMLYLGYVGFSVPFAFAIAALLSGQLTRDWVRWSRPWTHAAWAFLTLGITLGSWWAYYELGWGGWWFWDPSENASFMPWIAGTALIHSQAVTEKRGAFVQWTLLLSITAFALSLLGTFLVRSGVLTSVHAFAADPTRGVFILMYLSIVVGGALLLFALRAKHLPRGGGFNAGSKDTLLLLNNVLLVAMTAMVLIGTLYPLLIQALDLGKLSVGPPYFALFFMLLMIPITLLMPLGAFARWKRDHPRRYIKALLMPMVLALLTCLVLFFLLPQARWLGVVGTAGAVWLILGSAIYLYRRIVHQRGRPPLSEYAMTLAHIGVGVFIIGASLSSTTSEQRHLSMRPGDNIELNGYTFQFTGVNEHRGPNYTAQRGEFSVRSGDTQVITLQPEKRRYSRGGQIMTEAAIDASLSRDLYISLGEPLDENGAWAVRVYHKPFVRWIWLGGLMIFAAGLLAAMDRRYRKTAGTN